jgi:hypothetical protein
LRYVFGKVYGMVPLFASGDSGRYALEKSNFLHWTIWLNPHPLQESHVYIEKEELKETRYDHIFSGEKQVPKDILFTNEQAEPILYEYTFPCL